MLAYISCSCPPPFTDGERAAADLVFVKEYREAVSSGVRPQHVSRDVFPYEGPLLRGATR